MDIDAQCSCVGIAQAKEYFQAAGIDFKLTPSIRRFRFGEGNARPIGRLPTDIPTARDIITICVDVVHSNIPVAETGEGCRRTLIGFGPGTEPRDDLTELSR